jgi:hypothetical protein
VGEGGNVLLFAFVFGLALGLGWNKFSLSAKDSVFVRLEGVGLEVMDASDDVRLIAI